MFFVANWKSNTIWLYCTHTEFCATKTKFSPLYWSSLFNRLDEKLFLYHWMTFRTQTTTHYVYYFFFFFFFALVCFCVYISPHSNDIKQKKNMCWVPANQTVLLMIQGCAMSWRWVNYWWNSCMFTLVGAISPHELLLHIYKIKLHINQFISNANKTNFNLFSVTVVYLDKHLF